MLTPLDTLLSYQHPAVVRRFQKEYPHRAEQAEQLFTDLLLFFWISKKHAVDQQQSLENDDLNFIFIMDEEMLAIDLMWHIFLLYTKDYMDFCEQYFGEYLHHLPDVVPILKRNQDLFDPEINLSRLLSYTYDHLGADVIQRWFSISSAD